MTVDEQTASDALPDTAAGRALRFVLDGLATRAAAVDEAAVGAVYRTLPDGWTWENVKGSLAYCGDRIGDFVFDEVIDASDDAMSAAVVGARGRTWEVSVALDGGDPPRLREWFVFRRLKPGIEIRPAAPGDGPALSEVSRRTPLDLDGRSLVIDPGDDYLAGVRLMGPDAALFVATFEGRPVGIHLGVAVPVRVAGQDHRALLLARSRVEPEHTDGGLWTRLNDMVLIRLPFPSAWDTGIAYVNPDNAKPRGLVEGGTPWSVRPYRAVLDAAALAAAAGAGRPAQPADGARLAELRNACHATEELYVPATAESMAERMSRAPEHYGWSDVLVGDRAFVGMWPAGETRTLTDGADVSVSRRAMVLDYGFEPGAEAEFEALLRAACVRAAAAGMTHVGVFSSAPSPAAAVLEPLADAIEPYDLLTLLPEPTGAAAHGVYTDPVWF